MMHYIYDDRRRRPLWLWSVVPRALLLRRLGVTGRRGAQFAPLPIGQVWYRVLESQQQRTLAEGRGRDSRGVSVNTAAVHSEVHKREHA